MGGGVAGGLLQGARRFEDVANPGVGLHQLLEAGLGVQGLRQGDVELVGDQLGDAVHFRIGHLHHASDVADGGLRPHGAEGDDLADVVLAVLVHHIVDDLGAAVHAEVHVDVGQGDALGVQEALEQQAVDERVQVGDAQGVGDQAAGARAASRADGNAARPGEVNDVPDDQKVAREPH